MDTSCLIVMCDQEIHESTVIVISTLTANNLALELFSAESIRSSNGRVKILQENHKWLSFWLCTFLIRILYEYLIPKSIDFP